MTEVDEEKREKEKRREDEQQQEEDEERQRGGSPFKSKAKLGEEIDSWKAFAEALRVEDRELFEEMLQRCWSYSDSVEASGDDECTTEALLISLLVSQQKEINSLSKRLGILKRSRR